MPPMAPCPRCGAQVPLAEREQHARCPYCATHFLPPDDRDLGRFLVPWGATPLALAQALRDHRLRAGLRPEAAGLPAPADVRKIYLPFLRGRDGAMRPAFETHHPELRAFVPPGSDLKIFAPDRVEAGSVVIEPAVPPDAGAGETLVLYPFARLTVAAAEREQVFWVDASRGRVVVPGLDREVARGTAAQQVGRILLGAFGSYFAAGLLLPLPWSMAAAAVATPFLLRWASREIGAAR